LVGYFEINDSLESQIVEILIIKE